MNTKQISEIIKIYAEVIDSDRDIHNRIRRIENLKDTFGSEIPNCDVLLREHAQKKNLLGLQAALDLNSDHTPPPSPQEAKPETKKSEAITIYTPSEETEDRIKKLDERRMCYAIMMGFADNMYRQGEITLDKYYIIQDVFSEYYGFTTKSIFYWDGPHQGETVVLAPRKRNKTYTRRNMVYWEEYENQHKK